MGLDRDELAARFAVSAYPTYNGTPEDFVAYAVKAADRLIAALTPTPPPRESGTGGKYEPKVGDVCSNATYTIVFTGFRPDGGMNGWILKSTFGSVNRTGEWSDWQVKQFAFVRPATASERAAAGLPPCPPPPPADARGKAYKALLAYAEVCEADSGNGGTEDDWHALLRKHGWDGIEPYYRFADSLRTRALSLARKAEGGAA